MQNVTVYCSEAGLGLTQAVVDHGNLARFQVQEDPCLGVPDGGDGDEGEGCHGLLHGPLSGARRPGGQGVDLSYQGTLDKIQVRVFISAKLD